MHRSPHSVRVGVGWSAAGATANNPLKDRCAVPGTSYLVLCTWCQVFRYSSSTFHRTNFKQKRYGRSCGRVPVRLIPGKWNVCYYSPERYRVSGVFFFFFFSVEFNGGSAKAVAMTLAVLLVLFF